jgi:hypothetical protein
MSKRLRAAEDSSQNSDSDSSSEESDSEASSSSDEPVPAPVNAIKDKPAAVTVVEVADGVVSSISRPRTEKKSKKKEGSERASHVPHIHKKKRRLAHNANTPKYAFQEMSKRLPDLAKALSFTGPLCSSFPFLRLFFLQILVSCAWFALNLKIFLDWTASKLI